MVLLLLYNRTGREDLYPFTESSCGALFTNSSVCQTNMSCGYTHPLLQLQQVNICKYISANVADEKTSNIMEDCPLSILKCILMVALII